MTNILIRVDSSSKIGLGHLMRCLVLASRYNNSNVIFASQDLVNNANQKIIDLGYKLEVLRNNSVKALVKCCKNNSTDMLIIDSYEISFDMEKKIKEQTSCKLMVLDDTYEKHYCDVLLNHNIYAKEHKYKNKVPSFCTIQCGSKFTLIREEFLKKYKKTKNKKFSLLICLGGSDFNNINLRILKSLKKLDITITLITSSSNKNIKKLEKYVLTRKNMNLIIDSNQIAKLMNNSNLASLSLISCPLSWA